ncbi:MAG: DEAD/DEAH box helicase family protein [Pirellulales bacterium]|nr:DEAD/DEAH box helicase family protein [Thermoguttaceae bacterium]MDD4788975.1 DEAD/DEAH box helicase family protein [Pirellulales bacterium]MDI9445016.1 DEAD/DEAH box helicase family protein [Planctomycetota bacterium]NLY99224.1 DEAD/DEAH box helicase family protein [Pirellulaceae bacterium]
MKLQFDANQQYQLDAVAAVTDLFDGQPQGAPEFSVVEVGDWGRLFAGQARTELGVGNQRMLAPDKLLANARTVQARNDIEIADAAVPLESWELLDMAANAARTCPHFSVEMETGTGKTYVYLRTVFELSHRYGFQKFIIVVPSVAIREGAPKNIEITAEHFRALYNNEELINYLTALQVDHSVYEYVAYDSEVEREFAKRLDEREDIRLFVKLPAWFEIDTPVGKYNPDWAVLKHDGQTLYLVRETKSTKDFLKLRTSEADKVRCGKKHFETLGVPFEVVVSADEV